MEQYERLTKKELGELRSAIDYAVNTAKRIEEIESRAVEGKEIDMNELWELKNYASQIHAVLYNIHGGLYRRYDSSNTFESIFPNGHKIPGAKS